MNLGGGQSMFLPGGPGAASLARLGWIVLVVCAAVTIVMMGLLLWVTLRRRGTLAEHAPIDAPGNQGWILYGGFAVPLVILIGFFVLGIGALDRFPLHDDISHQGTDIRVIGHQWWWEVQYLGLTPGAQLTTANEIHIPTGQPVELALESRDVIHSFWVPELHGKVDLIPGNENHIRLQADQPGTYEGQCAEFCGVEHARMRFLVIAQRPEEFAQWLAAQEAPAQSPAEPTAAHGEKLFVDHACGLCHTVRGTEALGTVGPDLTHVGSRQRLAADSLPNTHAYVSAWITRAQSFKPGAKMPDVTDFRGDELEALSRYVQQLR